MTRPAATMRAAVATAPGVIHLERRPTPLCGPGELKRLDEAARLMERREALKVYVEVGDR